MESLTPTDTTTTAKKGGRKPKPIRIPYYKELDPTAAERVQTNAHAILADANASPHVRRLAQDIIEQATTHLDPVARLKKDIKTAAATMSREEARFMVDRYYQIQHDRITANSQIKSATEARVKAGQTAEPHLALEWLSDQNTTLESQITRALDEYTTAHEVGRWAKSIVGIGPIIAAGLLAHIDMDKADTAGHIWSFAGLIPGVKWEKGEKRPWNAKLKVLCWKIGESFVKFSNNPDCYYGKVYKERKELEWRRNLDGTLADQARDAIGRMKQDDSAALAWYKGEISPVVAKYWLDAGWPFTEGTPPKRLIPTVAEWSASPVTHPGARRLLAAEVDMEHTDSLASAKRGLPMLPPAHIHARAKRYAVKLFLAHWFEVAYRDWYAEEPPLPFPIAQRGHVHYISPDVGVTGNGKQYTQPRPRPHTDNR